MSFDLTKLAKAKRRVADAEKAFVTAEAALHAARTELNAAHDAHEEARRGMPAPKDLNGAAWAAWEAAGERAAERAARGVR